MRRTLTLMLAAALLTAFAGVVAADPGSPRLDRRGARQHARIADGVRGGDLTRAEARRLRGGQRRIHRMMRRAHADGVVTARERWRIHRAMARESRLIYRLKHNGRRV